MAAKFRSFLTMLGIIIGVMAVIVVMAIGASAQRIILGQIKIAGSNLVGILPGASDEEGPPAQLFGTIVKTLKYDDLQALLKKRNVPGVAAGSGYVTGNAAVKFKNISLNVTFQGVSSDLLNVENIKLESGRFFSAEEEINLARTAVIGANVSADLFYDLDPIGKTFTLKNQNFVVIGVLEKRGSASLFSNPDDIVYVPLLTGQKLLLGIDYLNFIRLKAESEQEIDRVIVDVKSTLREQHNIGSAEEDDFSVRSTAQALSTLSNVTNILKYFLVSIAAISLLVGGVGIMNIMLIAVNQRIREVGLRKAVGARNAHIISQFLIESVAVTFFGGILGVISGISIAYLAAVIIQELGHDWEFIVTWQSIVLAAGVTVLVGLVFGMYPAKKASKVSPMEALRYE